MTRRSLLGQDFQVGERAALREALLAHLRARGAPRPVIHANLHSLYLKARDPGLAAALSDPAATVLFEGVALSLACRVLRGESWPDVNGTDLAPELLAAAPRGLRVALVGGRPGVARQAAARLSRAMPHLDIALVADGFAEAEDVAALARRLDAAGAQAVLLGLGSPRQEALALALAARCQAPLLWAVGGLLDRLAGRAPRAPAVLLRLRLEWLWRVLREPRRLWRRILVEGPWLAAQVAAEAARARARADGLRRPSR